jgi:hypothetical protein
VRQLREDSDLEVLKVQELVVLLSRLPGQAVEGAQGAMRGHLAEQEGRRPQERGVQKDTTSSTTC